jgi:hypothetical protein
MFLSIGFNLFSAKDCQPQKNLLYFPQLLPDKGKTFFVKNLLNITVKVKLRLHCTRHGDAEVE